jgi:hypothetical protein
LPGITPSICTVIMFLKVNTETVFPLQSVAMFVTYVHTRFHTASTNSSLPITIKLMKATENFYMDTILLLKILQKRTLQKLHHSSFQNSKGSGVSAVLYYQFTLPPCSKPNFSGMWHSICTCSTRCYRCSKVVVPLSSLTAWPWT